MPRSLTVSVPPPPPPLLQVRGTRPPARPGASLSCAGDPAALRSRPLLASFLNPSPSQNQGSQRHSVNLGALARLHPRDRVKDNLNWGLWWPLHNPEMTS